MPASSRKRKAKESPQGDDLSKIREDMFSFVNQVETVEKERDALHEENLTLQERLKSLEEEVIALRNSIKMKDEEWKDKVVSASKEARKRLEAGNISPGDVEVESMFNQNECIVS